MSDDLDPERAEPVAVGPPRHRMNRLERIRARRTHNRRRLVAALAVVMLAAVVKICPSIASLRWRTRRKSGRPARVACSAHSVSRSSRG